MSEVFLILNFRDNKYLCDPDLCMLPIHAVHYGEAENLTWGPEQDVVCLCTLTNSIVRHW